MDTCQKYDQAQSEHCDCVDETKADETRTQLVRHFYETHNPEGVDKVEGLMEKVDSSKKMVGLLLKLIKRYYPKTIREVKKADDPKMREMMQGITVTSHPPENKENLKFTDL